jgi:hypothetical protein
MRQYKRRAITAYVDLDKADVQLLDSQLHHHRRESA